MKLDRFSISGQKYGTFDLKDESASLLYHGSSMNLNEVSVLPPKWNDKNFIGMSKWYTEITNTHPNLELDQDLHPATISIIPSVEIQRMDAIAEEYCQKAIMHIEKSLVQNPD